MYLIPYNLNVEVHEKMNKSSETNILYHIKWKIFQNWTSNNLILLKHLQKAHSKHIYTFQATIQVLYKTKLQQQQQQINAPANQ